MTQQKHSRQPLMNNEQRTHWLKMLAAAILLSFMAYILIQEGKKQEQIEMQNSYNNQIIITTNMTI